MTTAKTVLQILNLNPGGPPKKSQFNDLHGFLESKNVDLKPLFIQMFFLQFPAASLRSTLLGQPVCRTKLPRKVLISKRKIGLPQMGA